MGKGVAIAWDDELDWLGLGQVKHDPANNESQDACNCDPQTKSEFKDFHDDLFLLVEKYATVRDPYYATLLQGL